MNIEPHPGECSERETGEIYPDPRTIQMTIRSKDQELVTTETRQDVEQGKARGQATDAGSIFA